MIPCDEEPSLENGLRILAKKMRDVFEVQCHLSIPPESCCCCDPESSLHLIRIAQEAATNAIKHAMPQQIWVHLAIQDTVMVMSIENDGKNMKGNVDPQLSLGLRLMKFRTKRMGAALEIVPRPGGGTVVRCLFPLNRKGLAGSSSSNGCATGAHSEGNQGLAKNRTDSKFNISTKSE